MKVIAVKHIVLVCFGMLVLQLSSLGQGRTRNNTQTTVSAPMMEKVQMLCMIGRVEEFPIEIKATIRYKNEINMQIQLPFIIAISIRQILEL
jgi:hypothetical protein